MNRRRLIGAVARAPAWGVAALAIAAPAAALADAGGTPHAGGQAAATLRSAAARLVQAELNRDGATACGVLNSPLTRTLDGRTCAERWSARSAALLAKPGGAAHLEADLRATATAAVAIVGEHGSIALPYALLDGHSRFYWTANCWMLTK